MIAKEGIDFLRELCILNCMIAYKFRVYPDQKQLETLKQFAGCVRFVYNYMLALSKERYEKEGIKWNTFEYKKLLPKLKEEYPFLKSAPSQALQQAVINLGKAYENFFKGRAKFPKFKKKKHASSIYLPQGFKIEDRGKWLYLTIPKMEKPLKVRKHRQIEGIVKSITITLSPSGKVHVSMLVEREVKPLERNGKVVAIDLGLKDFAVIVDSEGNVKKIPHPKYLLRTERLLKRQQKKLSRKEKFSKNYQKQARKVAKLHEKVRNQRMDFLHKLSSAIIHENQVVVVEDLNIKGLLQNSRLSKAISDSGWAMFLTFLSYKAQLYGREVIFADRHFPSSKLCSVCGYKKEDLKLSEREWICPVCGTKHDRDINAGLNLLRYGLAHLTGSRDGTARTKACGDCSGGGMGLSPVYEPSVVEAGSSSFK